MIKELNEVFIVWEITPDYKFSTVKFDEEGAKIHVMWRKEQIVGTEMEGRDIFYKKYVVLE